MIASGGTVVSGILGMGPQEWTPTALLGIVVLMIFMGLLIPRWVMREIIKERDAWKKQATDLKDISVTLAQATKENMEPARTVAKVITAAQERRGIADDVLD